MRKPHKYDYIQKINILMISFFIVFPISATMILSQIFELHQNIRMILVVLSVFLIMTSYISIFLKCKSFDIYQFYFGILFNLGILYLIFDNFILNLHYLHQISTGQGIFGIIILLFHNILLFFNLDHKFHNNYENQIKNDKNQVKMENIPSNSGEKDKELNLPSYLKIRLISNYIIIIILVVLLKNSSSSWSILLFIVFFFCIFYYLGLHKNKNRYYSIILASFTVLISFLSYDLIMPYNYNSLISYEFDSSDWLFIRIIFVLSYLYYFFYTRFKSLYFANEEIFKPIIFKSISKQNMSWKYDLMSTVIEYSILWLWSTISIGFYIYTFDERIDDISFSLFVNIFLICGIFFYISNNEEKQKKRTIFMQIIFFIAFQIINIVIVFNIHRDYNISFAIQFLAIYVFLKYNIYQDDSILMRWKNPNFIDWNKRTTIIFSSVIISLTWVFLTIAILFWYSEGIGIILGFIFVPMLSYPVIAYSNPIFFKKPISNKKKIFPILLGVIVCFLYITLNNNITLTKAGDIIGTMVSFFHIVITTYLISKYRLKYKELSGKTQIKGKKKNLLICPRCKIKLENDLVNQILQNGHIFCRYCNEKIRKFQIFEFNSESLLKEHNKVLEKLGDKSSSIESD